MASKGKMIDFFNGRNGSDSKLTDISIGLDIDNNDKTTYKIIKSDKSKKDKIDAKKEESINFKGISKVKSKEKDKKSEERSPKSNKKKQALKFTIDNLIMDQRTTNKDINTINMNERLIKENVLPPPISVLIFNENRFRVIQVEKSSDVPHDHNNINNNFRNNIHSPQQNIDLRQNTSSPLNIYNNYQVYNTQNVPYINFASYQQHYTCHQHRNVVHVSPVNRANLNKHNIDHTIHTHYYPSVSQQMQPVVQTAKSKQNQAVNQGKSTHETQQEYLDDIRCVCGDNSNNGLLIQCEKCQMWLHGLCVNIARASSKEQFICPFCLDIKLKCRCKKNKIFSKPIVKCSKCNMWVHKECEVLSFGIIPDPFMCIACHHSKFKLPDILFTPQQRSAFDFTVFTDSRYDILQLIPEGNLYSNIQTDLNKSELNFADMITKYFNLYCTILFNTKNSQDFWGVIVNVFSSIFKVPKECVCNAIDVLANRLLYTDKLDFSPDPCEGFDYSESIQEAVEEKVCQDFPTITEKTRLYIDQNIVRSTNELYDGDFICDLPGFLMHTDEVYADKGIPRNVILLEKNSSLVIDLAGSSFELAPFIKRSFHYNCMAKIYRLSGRPRVGLFAVKYTSPLDDDRTRSNISVESHGEIILPLDGEIPFPVEEQKWRDAKSRARGPRHKDDKSKKKIIVQRKPVQASSPVIELTLLSAFLEDYIPPLPFQIISHEEAMERAGMKEKIRERIRNRNLLYDD